MLLVLVQQLIRDRGAVLHLVMWIIRQVVWMLGRMGREVERDRVTDRMAREPGYMVAECVGPLGRT